MHSVIDFDVPEIIGCFPCFAHGVRSSEPADACANFKRLSPNVIRHAEQLLTLRQRSYMEKRD